MHLVGRDMLSSVPANLFQHLGFRQAECRGKCGNRDRYLSGRRIYDRGDAKRRQQLRAKQALHFRISEDRWVSFCDGGAVGSLRFRARRQSYA
jgi:hypothetical protein